MNEINEIKLPKGVDRVAVKQHDDKIVIEFIPEKPKFNRGDILISIVTPGLTVIFDKMTSITAFDSIYNNVEDSNHYWSLECFRNATEEEKQEFFDELKADGKQWNSDKKCIEDIPQPKFKAGDKVRIKDGISSKTHESILPCFRSTMDKFIGEKLTVKEHTGNGDVIISEDDMGYMFAEDWLEPWSDEPKKGDLAIFWDDDTSCAIIRLYDKKGHRYHYDSSDGIWNNAIKFESKEQFEKVLREEID